MTLAITSMLRINPIPFFMTQIMASNIGGTATLIAPQYYGFTVSSPTPALPCSLCWPPPFVCFLILSMGASSMWSRRPWTPFCSWMRHKAIRTAVC